MSIVLFLANILLYILLCTRFPPLMVHGVEVYILFLETALFSLYLSKIVKHGDLKKSPHITRSVGQYSAF